MKRNPTRRAFPLALAFAVLAAAGGRAADFGSEVEGAVRAFSATGARVSAAAAAAPAPGDIPGVRERVNALAISVVRTCVGGQARYALYPISTDLGPALTAAAATLESSYLYPQKSGLTPALTGDAAGAALTLSAGGTTRAVGTIAPEDGPCSPSSYTDARLIPAPGVAAELSVQPRTGIFRPACYKDFINGFYKLDTWTVLTLSSPDGTMTVRIKDGMSFPDEGSCRDFYRRAK